MNMILLFIQVFNLLREQDCNHIAENLAATLKEAIHSIAGQQPFVFLCLMIYLSTKSGTKRLMKYTNVELFST